MMNEPEVDDVAFLTGQAAKKQVLYRDNLSEPEKPVRRIVCSPCQTFCFLGVLLSSFIAIALIAALARPVPRCPILAAPPLLATPSSRDAEANTEAEDFAWHDIRLPDFQEPLHYDLFVHPNVSSRSYTGSVNITFRLRQASSLVVLHCGRELQLSRLHLVGQPPLRWRRHAQNEQLQLELAQPLEARHEHVLWVDFARPLHEKLEGFYLSSYKNSEGQKRYLATTHFQPTLARAAFPCFDEPALKATFRLTIVHAEGQAAYSNAATLAMQRRPDGLAVTTFRPTPRMSTYLLAFVVCDFKALQKTNPDGVTVRVLVPPDQLNQAQYALDTAAEVLHFFHLYFNISYPLSKLDMIAIPDFGPGAMENWGLVTYRMTTILYNPNETSSESKEHVATVIAHELAHQWFGNLVTMQWWNDLWLNEGFASFVEHLGINHVEPGWRMMDQFIVSTSQDAMSLDGLESSHPVMTDVDNPEEIDAIFDFISYKKGAAILYMLENFLGKETMKKGLSAYLNKYRFKNARTQDLWDAFTTVSQSTSHVNVSQVLDTWTRQKGYPLLRVTLNQRHVRIMQQRFLLTPPTEDVAQPKDISPYGYKWYVPVTYVTDAGVETTFWLNKTDGEFLLPRKPKWIKLNVNQTGFYRVMYDNESWNTLITLLRTNHLVFKPADRANLLDDALTLARVGILDSELAFNLTHYLEKEEDYVPWETAILHMEVLDVLMQESPALSLFHKYVKTIMRPISNKLGWTDEGDHLKKKLRSAVLRVLMKFDDEETVSKATEIFQNWMHHNVKVAPNLRSVVYSSGVKYGGQAEWQFCWKQYQETQVPSEKRLLLTALGFTKDTWQLAQYLNYSLDKDKVRPQDTALVIGIAARNPIGRLLTWRFVRMNWPYFVDTFGPGSFSMDMILSESISHFSSQFDYDEVQSFFSKRSVGTGTQSLQQSLERVRANIRWRQNTEAAVTQWLQRSSHTSD